MDVKDLGNPPNQWECLAYTHYTNCVAFYYLGREHLTLHPGLMLENAFALPHTPYLIPHTLLLVLMKRLRNKLQYIRKRGSPVRPGMTAVAGTELVGNIFFTHGYMNERIPFI